ncbi:DUF4407 domain-containing protein [Nocardia blacklockiae]|uniref:DUF4407 domain-containing protein n=1 Tax=Nocardia blacklockiae TaxID=480036 RepID=UPI001892DA41|nr:DUF4407 domain-containing protein [Nocardia blacklockiae]MBF6175690.1 DUF4407 domain-containing protein [Nocardia blacklockiae]
MTADPQTSRGREKVNGHHRPPPGVSSQDTDGDRAGRANSRSARWLRSRAGIDETILDWVPLDRPRYTLLGTIIVNTGVLAGISLILALAGLVRGWWILLLIPFGACWGWLIMTLDRWLIASTHGIPQRSKLAIFAPRLAISFLLGFAIAEPLVLWIFQVPIRNEVAEHRKAEIDAYESLLKTCNPVTGSAPAGPDCAANQVIIPDSPTAIEHELSGTNAQILDRKAKADSARARFDELNDRAQKECAGTSGPGLTGEKGVGDQCRRDRADADDFRETSRLDQQESDLIALQNAVGPIEQRLSAARSTAGTEIATAVTTKVQQKRDNLRDRGILDDIAALGRLTEQSWAVFIGSWVVRLLLVALDCMPVLSKMISGTTSYDTMVDRQSASANRRHAAHVQHAERDYMADLEVENQIVELRLRNRSEDLLSQHRFGHAQRATDVYDQMEKYAKTLEDRYRRDPSSMVGNGVEPAVGTPSGS